MSAFSAVFCLRDVGWLFAPKSQSQWQPSSPSAIKWGNLNHVKTILFWSSTWKWVCHVPRNSWHISENGSEPVFFLPLNPISTAINVCARWVLARALAHNAYNSGRLFASRINEYGDCGRCLFAAWALPLLTIRLSHRTRDPSHSHSLIRHFCDRNHV